MDEKELKALMEGIAEKNGQTINEAVKKTVDLALKGVLKSEDLPGQLEAVGLKNGTVKQLVEAVKQMQEAHERIEKTQTTQGEEMRKIFQTSDVRKTLKELITEKADLIKAIARGGPNVKMTVDKTLVTRALVAGSTMAMRLPDVGQLAYPSTVIQELFRHAPVSPSSNGVIRYYDQVAVTRGANWVAEGATKPESAISWAERLLPIEKVADSIPVTKEAWNDVYFIQSEIQRLLDVNLTLKIEQGLYSGTGVTPEIKGVYTSAPAFVDTPYIDSVEAANLFDLILVVAADIAANRGSKYAANTVLLNPADMLKLQLYKDGGGRYLVPPGLSANGLELSGLKIVPSSQVTVNTMVVGDFRYGTIYELEDTTVEMGWINDQFIKNTFTILAEARLALLIRTGDETAFRKVANITTALANLETP